MEFVFRNAAGAVLFVRDDAESAHWTVDQLCLDLVFPYVDGKEIQRGQQILFIAPNGQPQIFEARTVKNYEPDHSQEIHAEHIALAELTDCHMTAREIDNQTPAAVLASILTGTGWSVGDVSATNTSSADLTIGSVWQNIHTIEANWNVYILPRVDLSGGRYLDIVPGGARPFRGVRLSIDKNADEIGVTYDDTNVITAMYGYGKQSDGVPLTFESVVWAETADHPAKPAGQAYINDPAATAAYGRNGRPRFGYYQNGNIDNAQTLLEKTWESLKTTNEPRVTIDCMIRDLYRLGYADEKIELHDMALIEIRPIGVVLQREIIRLSVDLLDPTATRPTIGEYVPNIVYIQRVVADMAAGGIGGSSALDSIIRGGSGGGGRGGGNGRGSTSAEQQISEFETEIAANNYQISLRAYQRDMTNVENIIKEAGVAIDAGGVIIYAGNNLNNMQSSITTNAGQITLLSSDKVDKSSITVGTDYITIDTKTLNITSALVVKKIRSQNVVLGQLTAGTTLFNGNVTLSGSNSLTVGGTISFGGNTIYARAVSMGSAVISATLLGTTSAALNLNHSHGINVDAYGNITIGGAQSNNGSVNMSNTAYFQQQIALAEQRGAADVTVTADGFGVKRGGYFRAYGVAYKNGTQADSDYANYAVGATARTASGNPLGVSINITVTIGSSASYSFTTTI